MLVVGVKDVFKGTYRISSAEISCNRVPSSLVPLKALAVTIPTENASDLEPPPCIRHHFKFQPGQQ